MEEASQPRNFSRNLKSRMAYHVRIMARAKRDFLHLYAEMDVEHSEAVKKWYWGLRDSVSSLATMPYRSPLAQEEGQLRHLLYGHKPHAYRVIYRIRETEKLVEVLHIRHGARQRFSETSLR